MRIFWFFDPGKSDYLGRPDKRVKVKNLSQLDKKYPPGDF